MARNRGFGFYRKKKKISFRIIKEILSYIVVIVIAVFLGLAVTYFFGVSTKIIGDSMEPVLYNGQTIYLDRFSYVLGKPNAGDVVAFLPNGNENEHYSVKRVIAVGGDRVKIQDGICYVNGSESPHVTERIAEAGIAANEFLLEPDTYFCIGDNTGNSEDSRSANIGPVGGKDILGRVWFHAGTGEIKAGFVK